MATHGLKLNGYGEDWLGPCARVTFKVVKPSLFFSTAIIAVCGDRW